MSFLPRLICTMCFDQEFSLCYKYNKRLAWASEDYATHFNDFPLKKCNQWALQNPCLFVLCLILIHSSLRKHWPSSRSLCLCHARIQILVRTPSKRFASEPRQVGLGLRSSFSLRAPAPTENASLLSSQVRLASHCSLCCSWIRNALHPVSFPIYCLTQGLSILVFLCSLFAFATLIN